MPLGTIAKLSVKDPRILNNTIMHMVPSEMCKLILQEEINHTQLKQQKEISNRSKHLR